jgi:hypothetical protein
MASTATGALFLAANISGITLGAHHHVACNLTLTAGIVMAWAWLSALSAHLYATQAKAHRAMRLPSPGSCHSPSSSAASPHSSQSGKLRSASSSIPGPSACSSRRASFCSLARVTPVEDRVDQRMGTALDQGRFSCSGCGC